MMPRSPEREWDWPPQRRDGKFRHTIEHDASSGWASPRAKKAVDIYWRIMITTIKVLIAVPLTILLIGSLWLLWTILTLPRP
jgi:hypothetical protein